MISNYDEMIYRRCGRSGLQLPAISLGLWQGFGSTRPGETMADVVRAAFEHGITHFDLANNYGPPPGGAEDNFGRMLRSTLAGHRDELVITTKAGWLMWPGPYGNGGSRKYLLASLDQSLDRLGTDYVDIFYSHRYDFDTPLDETIGALDTAVRSGKALYVGVSSYTPAQTREALRIARSLGTPLLVHQPSYSLLNRWIEHELLTVLREEGLGCVAFSVLAQGALTGKYVSGIPAGSRAATAGSLPGQLLDEEMTARLRGLAELAAAREQSLAQFAISWALRNDAVTTVLLGASSVQQLEENLGALSHLSFSDAELAAIEQFTTGSEVNLWVPKDTPSARRH